METVDGSAVSGEDFVAVDQVIEFQPKEVEKEVRMKFPPIQFDFVDNTEITSIDFFSLQIMIEIMDDDQYEPDEQFYLKLSLAHNLSYSSTSKHSSFIWVSMSFEIGISIKRLVCNTHKKKR